MIKTLQHRFTLHENFKATAQAAIFDKLGVRVFCLIGGTNFRKKGLMDCALQIIQTVIYLNCSTMIRHNSVGSFYTNVEITDAAKKVFENEISNRGQDALLLTQNVIYFRFNFSQIFTTNAVIESKKQMSVHLGQCFEPQLTNQTFALSINIFYLPLTWQRF